MPRKLDIQTVKVTLRLEAEDTALLQAVYAENFNAAVRAILGAVADRHRARLAGMPRAADAQPPEGRDAA